MIKEQYFQKATVKTIKLNQELINGIRYGILEKLKISHSEVYVNDIAEKIDLLIEYATEMGIDLEYCNLGEKVKKNIKKSRQHTLSEL